MFNTFDPPIPPSPGTDVTQDIKLLVAEFGDGYEQTGPDGLNHIRRKISLKWDQLMPLQANLINTFFTDQAGYIPFYYTPSNDPAPIKWTCKRWNMTRNKSGLRAISAELVESFSPDV